MSSYAGLVARLKQTGGPDKEAWTQGRTRRACVPLKRCIMDNELYDLNLSRISPQYDRLRER